LIYPANFETKTGFDQIRNRVKGNCLFEPGKVKADEMRFSSDPGHVRNNLELTAEFKHILLFSGNFPTDNYNNLSPSLKKARIPGTFLDTEEVFNLRKSLETIKAILRFFKAVPAGTYPRLSALASGVNWYQYVEDKIDALLNRHGKIKDNASNELRHIREQIAGKTSLAGKRLMSLLKKAIDEGYVDSDTTLSMRNGRQVIPVPANHKRKISGIVHDESATGKTAFVEPAEIVEINNEIRELEGEELREIIRILTTFTDAIRPYLDDLLATFDFLATIDFIRAKALFAIEIGAGLPALVPTPVVRWKQAFHPLLLIHHRKENKPVVPLDIELDEKARILLISGPNAGGKSVCLKTVGLNQYMLQCGMLIPVVESSEAGLFSDVLIDIGDEQSIENDLSTYSSHLLNMKNFLRHASSTALLLIDEFGTGTEPNIGGAIAEALLEAFNARGAYGVITTHYSNLKHYASSAPGIVNGAMMFDTGKMTPLFRLEMGKPGSSFAIDIARQIGLPEEILKHAAGKVGEDHVNFDRHLREIIRDKRYWGEKRDRIRQSEKRMSALLEQYEGELSQMKKMRKEILDHARHEADALLAGANREIEKTIRTIREQQAGRDQTKQARKELQSFKDSLAEPVARETDLVEQKLGEVKKQLIRVGKSPLPAENDVDQLEDRKIEVGDRVEITGLGVTGEVMELNGDNALVSYGESMITTVKLSKLGKTAPPKDHRPKTTGTYRYNVSLGQRRLNFKPEVDIRGKRGEEAVAIVRSFIDDAHVVGISELRILHGKGNGILKSLVREYIMSLNTVRSCRDEHEERGGAGITVVTLDF